MADRVQRLNELLQQEVSLLLHSVWRDETPHLTVTGVEVSPNLRHAYIYYSVIGLPGRELEAAAFLERVRKDLRARLASRIRLKYLPDLHFRYDEGPARGQRVEEVLGRLGLTEHQP